MSEKTEKMDSFETYFGIRISGTWVECEPISELGKIGRGQRYFRRKQAKDLYIS